MNTTNYLENENKKQENKTEDRKALPKLIVLMIISGSFGALFAGVALKGMEYLTANSGTNLLELFQNKQMALTTYAGYAAFLLSVILSVAGLVTYNRCKKIALTENMDNEEVRDRIETGLNISLLITSINTIMSWLLFGISFYCIVQKEDLSKPMILSVILSFVGFLLQLVCTSINQQKVINLEKEMNPEKNGSVYDLQFHKKWMESCDEAERFFAYKGAFFAFRTSQMTCLILGVILSLVGMVFPIGILPLLCVVIIWGVSTIVYIVSCMKLEKNLE